MYDTPIPIINYVMVGITASVLAYATAMDVKDNNENSSALSNLPSNSDESISNSESEQEPEEEPEPEPEPEQEEEQEPEEAEARVANTADNDEPVADARPVMGGKHNKKKHKKKTIRKKQKTDKKKHKKTRNNISRK